MVCVLDDSDELLPTGDLLVDGCVSAAVLGMRIFPGTVVSVFLHEVETSDDGLPGVLIVGAEYPEADTAEAGGAGGDVWQGIVGAPAEERHGECFDMDVEGDCGVGAIGSAGKAVEEGFGRQLEDMLHIVVRRGDDRVGEFAGDGKESLVALADV